MIRRTGMIAFAVLGGRHFDRIRDNRASRPRAARA